MKEPETRPTPDIDPAAIASAASGLNTFTLALYQQVPKAGNTVLSPFSVATALSLLELGAKGDASAVLLASLGAKSDNAHRSGLQGLLAQLTKGEPEEQHGETIHPHTLSIGNSLWTAKDYSVESGFVDSAKRYYGAEVAEIDVADPDKSAGQINRWTSDATSGKIKDIVSPALIGPLTRMILVNATHFVGRWRDPFSASATEDRPFYVKGEKEPAQVATMLTGHYFKSLTNDDVTLLELPYWSTRSSAKIAMTLIVPTKREGLSAVEAQLTPALLEEWISSMQANRKVTLYLPKWKAKTTAELSEPLHKMGLAKMFGPSADLSGISNEEGLEVSAVLHKTFISVDEKGTEAAAATAIMMAGSAMSKPVEVRADHPFLYLIRDTESGAILFIGRVVDPR